MKKTKEDVRALVRYDIGLDEFLSGTPRETIEYEPYTPTWDDIEALLFNIENKDPSARRLFREWGTVWLDSEVWDDDIESETRIPELFPYSMFETLEESERYQMACDWIAPYSPGSARRAIVHALADLSYSSDYSSLRHIASAIDFPAIRRDIEIYKNSDFSSQYQGWDWTDMTKIDALYYPYGHGFGGITIEKSDLPRAREVLADLVARGNREAIEFVNVPSNKLSYIEGKLHKIASCVFSEFGASYDYLCDDVDVGRGDKAVVETMDGKAVVRVEDVHYASEYELPLPFNRYRKIICVVSDDE